MHLSCMTAGNSTDRPSIILNCYQPLRRGAESLPNARSHRRAAVRADPVGKDRGVARIPAEHATGLRSYGNLRCMIRALIKKMLGLTWKALPPRMRNLLIRTCMSSMTDKEKFRAGFPTMPGLLKNIGESGFFPLTIIDVGANVGGWARMASLLFPPSRILMF